MPYFALIIIYYHVKISCYQNLHKEKPQVLFVDEINKKRRVASASKRGKGRKQVTTCIYNLNSYLISLIFMLILCNYDARYLNFMKFLHWNVILLKFIFMHNLGLIMSFLED